MIAQPRSTLNLGTLRLEEQPNGPTHLTGENEGKDHLGSGSPPGSRVPTEADLLSKLAGDPKGFLRPDRSPLGSLLRLTTVPTPRILLYHRYSNIIYYLPHFSSKGIETQRGQATSPRSQLKCGGTQIFVPQGLRAHPLAQGVSLSNVSKLQP